MPNDSLFRWNARAARYVDASGRFVRPARVRRWLDQALDTERRRMRNAGAAFLAGSRTPADLAAFERTMRAGIKTTHLLAAMSARGGFAQMTPAEYGRVGQIVRFHYGRLERWMRQLADGDEGHAPVDGRFTVRARMYATASLGTHYQVARRMAVAAGYTQEQNVLGAADRHCPGCLAETARGWVPIGALVPIGQRECLGACVCSIEFGEVAP